MSHYLFSIVKYSLIHLSLHILTNLNELLMRYLGQIIFSYFINFHLFIRYCYHLKFIIKENHSYFINYLM